MSFRITCSTHVQNKGWMPFVDGGQLSGTTGKSLRIEAMKIKFEDVPPGFEIYVAYRSHVENIGWQDTVSNGEISGTVGQGLRLEAFAVSLFGLDSQAFSIWYRGHIQNEGWTQWERDGNVCGTTGQALRVEAIQIIVTKKENNLIRNNDPGAVMNTVYRSHVENIGWKAWVMNGQASGTTGRGLRLEAFELKLTETFEYDLGIAYRSHVQNIGWQPVVVDGETSGTTGQGLRLEAIEINLTGADAYKFKVLYRGHIENYGWTEWREDGQTLGTTGEALRAESICVAVVMKDEYLNGNAGVVIKNKIPFTKVVAVDYPLDEYLLHDIRSEFTLSGVLTLTEEINKIPTLQFSMHKSHKFFDKIIEKRTIIKVFDVVSSSKEDLVFEGRVITKGKQFNNNVTFSCEGELAYLLDSIQRPASYVDQNIDQWMTAVLDNHNAQMTTEKHIYMGIVTKNNLDNNELRKNDYIDSFSLLQENLIDVSGGILEVEHIGGCRFLNYRESIGRVNTQVIMFAKNLINYSSTVSAGDLITALIPVGKKIDGVYTTIASVNEGSDYIYNDEAVSLYGWIFGYMQWGEIEDAQALKNIGEEYLNSLINVNVSLTLTAFDLSLVNVDIEKIKVGDYVRCISNPHGIDDFFVVSRKTRDFFNLKNSKVILGDLVPDITRNMFDDKKELLKKIALLENNKRTWIEYGNYPLNLSGVTVIFDHEHKIPPVINPSILKNVNVVGGGEETAKNISISADLIIEYNDDGDMIYKGCVLKFDGTLSPVSDWFVSVQVIGTYV